MVDLPLGTERVGHSHPLFAPINESELGNPGKSGWRASGRAEIDFDNVHFSASRVNYGTETSGLASSTKTSFESLRSQRHLPTMIQAWRKAGIKELKVAPLGNGCS
jgi:hypothetical protein